MIRCQSERVYSIHFSIIKGVCSNCDRILLYIWGRVAVVVCALDFRCGVGGLRSGPFHRIVSLDKKLYPALSLFTQGINGYRRHTAGGNPAMN